MDLPRFDGWYLIGVYESDVGSWLLTHRGEALLLEVPEGLTVPDVAGAVGRLGVTLRYVTASHEHWDHLDCGVWTALRDAFPGAEFVHPTTVRGDRLLEVGGEPVWLVKAPKHSPCDVVTVFRGVAMTGDIELGTLDSVTSEVPRWRRKQSMRRLQGFEDRCGYHVHTVFSAHLDDLRVGVRWPDLFSW